MERMNMNEAMEKEYNFVGHMTERLAPITNVLSLTGFGSMVCMLMEELALKNKADVNELADMLAEMVHSVNDEEGKYEGGL